MWRGTSASRCRLELLQLSTAHDYDHLRPRHSPPPAMKRAIRLAASRARPTPKGTSPALRRSFTNPTASKEVRAWLIYPSSGAANDLALL